MVTMYHGTLTAEAHDGQRSKKAWLALTRKGWDEDADLQGIKNSAPARLAIAGVCIVRNTRPPVFLIPFGQGRGERLNALAIRLDLAAPPIYRHSAMFRAMRRPNSSTHFAVMRTV